MQSYLEGTAVDGYFVLNDCLLQLVRIHAFGQLGKDPLIASIALPLTDVLKHLSPLDAPHYFEFALGAKDTGTSCVVLHSCRWSCAVMASSAGCPIRAHKWNACIVVCSYL